MTAAQMNYCKSLMRRTVGMAYLAFALVIRRLLRPLHRLNGSGLSDSRLSKVYAGLLRSFLLMQLNRVGLENDLSQLLALPSYSLRQLCVPTLVMHGTRDPVVPCSHAEFITRQVPDVTEILVPGGGHLFFVEQHDQLTPKVIEFVEKHSGEPGVMYDQRAGT